MVPALTVYTPLLKAQHEEGTTRSSLYSLFVAGGDWLKDT